jgi:hypothetical protein
VAYNCLELEMPSSELHRHTHARARTHTHTHTHTLRPLTHIYPPHKTLSFSLSYTHTHTHTHTHAQTHTHIFQVEVIQLEEHTVEEGSKEANSCEYENNIRYMFNKIFLNL